MSDIEQALAEALRTVLYYPVVGTVRLLDYDEAAAAILATEPMQEALRRLAKDIGATAYAEGLHDAETNPERDRQAAIGAAVERLPDHAVIKRKGERWHAYLYHREAMMPHGWETAMTRTTLPAAIAAALDPKP